MMTELGTGPDLERLAVTTARTLPEEYWRNRWGPVFQALMGILAEGRPATVEELAAVSGTPASQVTAGLPRDAERDDQGRVIGFGITLEPTPHRVEIDGHTVYAWCAGDTLGNLTAAGRHVRISSTCPATGQTITIAADPDGVTDINPPGAVVSVPLTGDPRDIRGSLCQRSNFFASAEAASEWLAHTPDGTLLSVTDAHRWALRTSQLIMREQAPPRTTVSTCDRQPSAGSVDTGFHDRWWEAHRELIELIPHVQRLLAAEGEPVTLDQIAAASSRSVADVEAFLGQQPGTDRDDQGRVVGLGLTLRPTAHRFTFGGRTVYGWCATDTLIFPVLLGRSGVIESTCPVTGRPIRIEVTPERVDAVEPAEAVVTLVRPDRFGDMRAEGCDLGLFFSSWEATAEWRAAYPEGMVHTIEEEFQLNRNMVDRHGWSHSESAAR